MSNSLPCTVYGIGYGLSALGSYFGPSIKARASSLIARQLGVDKRIVRNGVDSFCDVAGGVLYSTGVVLSGLEESVRVIGRGVKRNISESLALT